MIEWAREFIEDFGGGMLHPFMDKKIPASPNWIQNESCKQLKFPNSNLRNAQTSHRINDSQNPNINRLRTEIRNGNRPRRGPPQKSSKSHSKKIWARVSKGLL
jgi:hypothetical protein